MFTNFDEIQKVSKDNVERGLASFGAISKNTQTIAVETADYVKKSVENASAVFEDMLAAKTLDKAVALQNDYARSAYEDCVAQFARFNELALRASRDAYKPYEAVVNSATKAAKASTRTTK